MTRSKMNGQELNEAKLKQTFTRCVEKAQRVDRLAPAKIRGYWTNVRRIFI